MDPYVIPMLWVRCTKVRNLQDLETVSQTALALRAVGSSTEHAQSSRSHAILKMEVMNEETFEALEAVEEAKVLLPALTNAVDNHLFMCYRKLITWNTEEKDEDGRYTFSLREYPGGQQQWDAVRAEMVVRKQELEAALDRAMARIHAAYDRLEALPKVASVGGALVLVDLAGADHDKRDLGATTPQQRKESADINKSLLALKSAYALWPGSQVLPSSHHSDPRS